MSEVAENFLFEFHNITGTKLGERKKSLYNLLTNHSFSCDEEQYIIKNLYPKTYLETLFRIDVLIYFKKTSDLLQIFKDGNEVFISKIMKQPWFFQEAFNDYTTEEFVNNLLPSMSFCTKMKLMKKLPLVFTEERIDEIYDLIVDRYGLFIATSVIHNCSPKKIEHILKNNDVKLSTAQLKALYKKKPALINTYFEEYKEEVDKRIDNCFLVFIAQKDPDLFCILTKDYIKNRYLRLGRRTTKKFINSKKQDIIEEPEKYFQFLRNETLVRKLKKEGEMKKIYRTLFPQNMEGLQDAFILSYTLLKYYPYSFRCQLFTQTFQSVFTDSVLANFNNINEYLLEIIGDDDVRDNLAELKYKKTNDEKYIKYYKTEKCMMILKEKIHFTSGVRKRGQLLCLLVENCKINKDFDALEEVLKYFCERHRNEDNITKHAFLATIDRCFDHRKFSESHWKCINEIITILQLKQGIEINPILRVKYLAYLCKEKTLHEIEPAILEYIKTEVKYFSMNYMFIYLKNAEMEKNILLQIMQCLPKAIQIQNADDETYNLINQFVSEIFAYNARYPKNKIKVSENQHIVDLLRKIMERGVATTYGFNYTIIDEICRLNRNDFENEVVNYYWKEIFPRCPSDKGLLWYIKHDPLVILQHFESIIKKLPETEGKVYKKIKLYSHLNLDDDVIKHCLKQLSTGTTRDETHWIRPLSILCTPDRYIQFIENENLIPTSQKLHLTDEEINIFPVQKAVIDNFLNVKDPLGVLAFLMKTFCFGDYLQTTLSPLYSAFHKSPENALKCNLELLFENQHTSVRKHSLFLTCSLLDKNTVLDILERFGKIYDPALHKHAFLSTMKYFSKNPSEEFFKQVIFYTELLQESDIESFLVLSSTKIDRKFKPSFIQKVWIILETLKANDCNYKFGSFDQIFSPILNIINKDCLQKLPSEFCTQIIEKYFLVNEEAVQNDSVYKFVIKFLMYHGVGDEFAFVFNLLQKYKSIFWNKYVSLAERNNVYQFFKTFYKMACEKETNVEFVTKFKNSWTSVFSPIDAFQEFVLLSLLEFKNESNQDLEVYSAKIIAFSKKIHSEFLQLFSNFVNILYQFIDRETDKDRIQILLNMLKVDSTPSNCILVMDLIILKGDIIYKNKIRNNYHDIDSILRQALPNVQLWYNLYIKNVNYFE